MHGIFQQQILPTLFRILLELEISDTLRLVLIHSSSITQALVWEEAHL